jgi:UDP-GlcNAc:undecaprenyl-phosphate/decaprenyl-phosphate GlcNAc-1-phosphate transferase
MDATALARAAAFATVVFLVLAAVPLIQRFCVRFRIFDPPGPLKIHSTPIPRLGGVAIAAAALAGTILAVGTTNIALPYFCAALTLIWLAGLIDDFRGLSPLLRLVAQIGGAGLLYFGGWRLWPSAPSIVALLADCFWVVLFVNAFNFLDGTDGLAAGVTGVIAAAYILASGAALGTIGYALAWSLLGATAAFLVFNFPPAKIFMGDSGSSTLGFSVAFLGLDLIAAKNANTTSATALIFPLLVAALPLADALLAILRRVKTRRSPFQGDRRHFYDLLLAAGWTTRRVAITCYLLTAILAGLAWLATQGGAKRIALLGIAAGVALLWATLWLGALRSETAPPRSERVQF